MKTPKRIWVDESSWYYDKLTECKEYVRKGEELRGLKRFAHAQIKKQGKPDHTLFTAGYLSAICDIEMEIERRLR